MSAATRCMSPLQAPARHERRREREQHLAEYRAGFTINPCN